MKAFSKALTNLLGGLVGLYIILAISYATLNPMQFEILTHIEWRAPIAVACIACLVISYFVILDLMKPSSGFNSIQSGGLNISEQSMTALKEDIAKHNDVHVHRQRGGEEYRVYLRNT